MRNQFTSPILANMLHFGEPAHVGARSRCSSVYLNFFPSYILGVSVDHWKSWQTPLLTAVFYSITWAYHNFCDYSHPVDIYVQFYVSGKCHCSLWPIIMAQLLRFRALTLQQPFCMFLPDVRWFNTGSSLRQWAGSLRDEGMGSGVGLVRVQILSLPLLYDSDNHCIVLFWASVVLDKTIIIAPTS